MATMKEDWIATYGHEVIHNASDFTGGCEGRAWLMARLGATGMEGHAAMVQLLCVDSCKRDLNAEQVCARRVRCGRPCSALLAMNNATIWH